MATKTDLDKQDRAILRILQKNNRTPQRTIAERVNLSAAAVQRRIAAMEKSGVIARNVAIVNPDKIGATITSIVQVHLRDERASTVDQAKAMFRNVPEIQQCFYVTGNVSMLLTISVPDMPAYSKLIRRLFAENELVESYSSLIVVDRIKDDTAFVID